MEEIFNKLVEEFGLSVSVDKEGEKYVNMSNIRWFTNLKTAYKQPPLDMREVYYTPEKYPKYDNYDAINVDKVADIPCDYPGVMGVPLTFMDKYCPEQFRILGLAGKDGLGLESFKKYDEYIEIRSNGKSTGASGKKINGNPVILGNTDKGNYFINEFGKKVRSLYARIFIKNKHPIRSKRREKVNKFFTIPESILSSMTFTISEKVA